MYGQQITVPEQMKNNPSIFNNTRERFLLQNRIPLTLVMEPLTHFNNNNYTVSSLQCITLRDTINYEVGTDAHQLVRPTSDSQAKNQLLCMHPWYISWKLDLLVSGRT